MDTVSMLNTMRFYCQPILPLVYDESMSYYETLCKVVGQLNNTGETVNKLNEGLTGEIADREAGDAALDVRIKQIEETNSKLHFLKVDTLGHLLTADVTREKLSQWVQNGDIIAMLYAPDEAENSWAVATNYRSMGATGADTMQLNFYVPISITHNAGKSGSDVAQEVVVISLPVGELTNQWVVRSITSTVPGTNADGFVNLTASVSDVGTVTCDVEPGAIVEALRNYFSSTNQFAVAVNARLNYGGKQYHSGIATVKADTSGTGNIRIAFENYYDGVRAENGVRQTVNTTIFLVGDVKTNAWSVETIDHKTFDFSRYEGFQFTRGANNVITTDDESTPNAVYAQYHSDTSGKIYQNLPTRLIDTVDGAEYWNGTFDIYGGNHMSFTFVTSNYATSSDKMLVRVIELSADVGTTAWKYGVKEFTLPLTAGEDTTYVDFWPTGDETYDADFKAYTVDLASNSTYETIFQLIKGGGKVVARVYQEAAKTTLIGRSVYSNATGTETLGTVVFHFLRATDKFLGFKSVADFITIIKTSTSTSMFLVVDSFVLPTPNSNGSDSGKVPTVNGKQWELKTPTGGGSSDAVLYTPQTLTAGQKKQARENVGAWEAYNGAVPVVCEYEKYIPAGTRATKTLIVTSGQLNPPLLDAAATDVLTAWNYLMNTGTVFSPTRPKGAQTLVKHIATLVNAGIFGDSFMSTQGNVFEANTEFYKNGNNISIEAHTDKKLIAVRCTYPEKGIYFALYYYLETETFDDSGVFHLALTSSSLKSNDTVLTFPQQTMAAAPTEDMQIATKKYVDDGLAEKLSTQGGEISASLEVGQTVSAGGAMSVGRTSTDTGIHFEKAASDAGRVSHGSDAMSGVAPIARLKVASPTEDDDATTKGYVDGRAVRYDEAQNLTEAQQLQACKNIGAVGNNSPQFKGYLSLAPANEGLGLGVGLSPTRDGNNYALDISDVNENQPTKLTGVKTPTDADTNAATTVEFVLNKIKKAVSIDVEEEEVHAYNYADIVSEITNGGGNVWLSLGTEQLRMVAWNKTGASSYALTFVNLEITNFNIHTVTVSPSAATYTYITK